MKRKTPLVTAAAVALGAGMLLGGCDGTPAVDTSAGVAPATRREADYAQLLVETDLRRHDAALAISFLGGDAEHRIAAARGLALIGSEGALALLQRGLADPTAGVRREVSFGLALAGLPSDAWIGAYAVEADEVVRRQMTRDLGLALDLQRAGPILRQLEGPYARDACVGINQLLRRDPELPVAHVRRLQTLVSDADRATALACLHALAAVDRKWLAPVAASLTDASATGLRDADGDFRLAWTKLLSVLGPGAAPLLGGAADDPVASVAAAAFEQLARMGPGQLSTITGAVERRLTRVLAGRGTEADPSVLHAVFDAIPSLGHAAELAAWLGSVVDRLAPTEGVESALGIAGLHCAAARAFDRVREWPSRSLGCGGRQSPPWLGQVAALEVLSRAQSSGPLRASQFRRLYDQGDWHVKRATMLGLQGLPPELAQPLALDGLSHDHKEVRAAAVRAATLLLPRLRRTGESVPREFAAPLRAAFQEFHVTQHVAGLRAWLSVVRGARLRTELGGVVVLARSGITPVRDDARAVLAEWGHPLPTEPPEPVPDPVPRDQLSMSPTVVALQTPTGPAKLVLDPTHAPITVARVIQWLGVVRQPLEVSEWRPTRYLRLSDATGLSSTAWRSEESRELLTRGTVVVGMQRDRDGVSAALFVLLAAAPEFEGRVAVVGKITDGLSHLDRMSLGDAIHEKLVDTP